EPPGRARDDEYTEEPPESPALEPRSRRTVRAECGEKPVTGWHDERPADAVEACIPSRSRKRAARARRARHCFELHGRRAQLDARAFPARIDRDQQGCLASACALQPERRLHAKPPA